VTNMETDPNKTNRRNLIIGTAAVGLVVLTLLIAIVWLWRRSKAETEPEVTPIVSVKVVKAEKGEIAAQHSAVGTIWPREKADVSAKISAQIKQMALLKNKVVQAGEVIAVLESRDLQAQRAEAVAALNEARANEQSVVTGTIPKTNAEDQKALADARAKVNNARATYERRRALFERGGISQKDLEASQLDLTTAQDELRLQEQTVALRTRSLNPNDRTLAAARTAQAQQRVAEQGVDEGRLAFGHERQLPGADGFLIAPARGIAGTKIERRRKELGIETQRFAELRGRRFQLAL